MNDLIWIRNLIGGFVFFTIVTVGTGFSRDSSAQPKAVVWHDVKLSWGLLGVTIPECWGVLTEADANDLRLAAHNPCGVSAPDIDINISEKVKGGKLQRDTDADKRTLIATKVPALPMDTTPHVPTGFQYSRDPGGTEESTLLETQVNCGSKIAKVSIKSDTKFDGRKTYKVSEVKDLNLRRILRSLRCLK